jgi:hypothetical protein
MSTYIVLNKVTGQFRYIANSFEKALAFIHEKDGLNDHEIRQVYPDTDQYDVVYWPGAKKDDLVFANTMRSYPVKTKPDEYLRCIKTWIERGGKTLEQLAQELGLRILKERIGEELWKSLA